MGTTYLWTSLASGTTLSSFSATNGDVLRLGSGFFANSDAAVSWTSSSITFTSGGKSITIKANPRTFKTSTVVSSDSLAFAFGDGLVSASADDGATTLSGSTANDVLFGFGGADVVMGGSGVDRLYGGNGADTLYGGAGNDTLYGGDGGDRLTGDDGNDVLHGGSGNDTVSGGSGNDTLSASVGNDSLTGGAGNDTFVFSGLSGTDTITDFVKGTDLISISSAGAFSDLTITTSGSSSLVTLTNGSSFLVQGVTGLTSSNFTFATPTSKTGTSGADTLTSTSSNDYLQGGAGNDTYVYTVGDGGSDTILDTSGTDRLVLNFGTGSTRLATLGYLTDNTTVALTFSDGYVLSLKNQPTSGLETVAVQWEDVSGETESRVFTVRSIASTGNDLLMARSTAATLNAGVGNDVVAGSRLADTLNGGVGSDMLFGNAGSDILYGESSTTTSSTSTGDYDDELFGGAGNDTLYGQFGDDDLTGDAGNDRLIGGDGWDTARYDLSTSGIVATLTNGSGTVSDGLSGTDTLSGIEAISGSAYNDTLTFGTGNTSNLNFEGGAGNDTLVGTSTSNSEYVTYWNSTSSVTVNLSSSIYSQSSLTISAQTAWDGMGGTDSLSNIDGVAGSNYEDTLIGNGSAMLVGGAGNDSLIGSSGGGDSVAFWGDSNSVIVNLGSTAYSLYGTSLAASSATDNYGDTDSLSNIVAAYGTDTGDTLIGSTSTDTLLGQSGDDLLDGRAGADTLTGGDGADRFRFVTSSQGTDQITDFDTTEDKIELVSANFGSLGNTTTHLLSSTEFRYGTSFTTVSQRLLYNSSTGQLTYDSNGSASGGTTAVLATLSTGLSMTASNFTIVSS